jgi:dipeptidyl aminopeptidase/acylaminoacyl peptidase
LPEGARLSNFSYSDSEDYMAFTHTTTKGVELWLLDMNNGNVKKIVEDKLNANMGSPFLWLRNDDKLIVNLLPNNRPELINTATSVPEGPTVSVNEGKKAQNRTYQDLLKNKSDEANFDILAHSELYTCDLNGTLSPWMASGIYSDISQSPDGEYILITKVNKPYSYLVPYSRFPSTTSVYDKSGKLVQEILDLPLIEDLPKGFMSVRTGPRGHRWRSDKPATLYWAEALDGGDANIEFEERDAVYQLDAPFTGKKQFLLNTINRFSGIQWCDGDLAIASDYWWNTRNTKSYTFSPSDSKQERLMIEDRNYQDRYSDPGSFVTKKNEYGMRVLERDKQGNLFLIGDGYSEDGIKPFVDKYNVSTGNKDRLYEADGAKTLENIMMAIDMDKGEVLTRIESKSDYPNYYFRNINTGELKAVTQFENPFKAMQDVHKEVITYTREDGLELSATLYLPADYDKNKKEKLPMLMWAYPREYKDKNSASQVTSSEHEFTYPYYGSPLYWLMRGYVVLDDAAFPIVGEGDSEPNDTFRKQLVDNAKAAIDAVDDMGYIDRTRVGVGGHSYGAFMTANLLSHSNLFAAGIARSGAYNRTLTPFGFQSEERNYWEAPEVYYDMSPFMHAEKMKTPLLLIHGQADNNSGTYPMQSERYFNALKGLGATVRLVMLPKESHGYSARESVLHVLWEQDQWLEKYVKNKGQGADTESP